MTRLREIPLGEFFEFGGKTYVPIEGSCKVCVSNTGPGPTFCSTFECMRHLRKDEKSVAFITKTRYIAQLQESMR